MTMRILRNSELVEDEWTLIEDGRADIEAGPGKVIVTLARWRVEREALLRGHAAVGVLVPNTADIEAVFTEIEDRPLIVLQFPTFTDGRALSQAVVLRKRLGFRGELRAVGDVIRDLVFWLGRCGFDSIVPRKDQSLEGCREALREITVAYQAAADAHTPVWVRRRSGVVASH
ncbi:MAG TPA: DUF934 domain-containing protein [Steroidobacteraceae bacterium]|nr:DUF934 domain-containing protein [Steroidobacteraceae bacterium]